MAMTRSYTTGARVPADRSITEIQTLVRTHGATAWRYEERDDQNPALMRISFVLEGLPLRFTVTAPTRDEVVISPSGHFRTEAQITAALEQELRRRWRAVLLLITAKFAAIQAGVVDLQVEMLPYIVLDNMQTMAAFILPQVSSRQSRRDLPVSPPAFVEETPKRAASPHSEGENHA